MRTSLPEAWIPDSMGHEDVERLISRIAGYSRVENLRVVELHGGVVLLPTHGFTKALPTRVSPERSEVSKL